MSYKRVLTIQDISCVGQCSGAVALPVLSVCGCETCILPPVVLSTHTGGFGTPAVQHLAQFLPQAIAHWQRQQILFDVIYTGYLGSMAAIEQAKEIMDQLLAPGGIIIVDPAMADHGRLYTGFDEAYARAMTDLSRRADVVLPNITEAAMMTGLPYRESFDDTYIQALLQGFENPNMVLTGVGFRPGETGVAIRSNGIVSGFQHPRIEQSFHGTGDLFASCFTGALANGKPVPRAAQIASEFTLRCIENTHADPAHWYGVKFETALSYLLELLRE